MTKVPTILCVDDEIDNLDSLERLFRAEFKVLRALSGIEALEILKTTSEDIALILTDQRMPGMSGTEFLAESIQIKPNCLRILITGYTDVGSIVDAINSGQIYRYLTKPWDPMDLLNTVKRATERYKLNLELAQKTAALQTAYEDLKSLDQAKNQFMILINHELKTPLTSVLSYSSLLKESPLNDEQKLFLNRIEKSSWRLKNLIDDVLIVVAGETKTLKTKILTYSALELVSGLAEELTALKDKKNQKLVLSLTDKKLVADQSLISQVMARLIHNAVKFGFENSEIEVTGEQVRPHRYRVQVKNKGPQIKDGLIQKLLSPFYIDEDVMNHSVGMGLGLTICQSLLKAHQSKLELQNIEGGVMVSFEISCL